MSERQVFRTKVSQGYQVAVPAELRRKYGIGVGDEVVWMVDGGEVRTDFKKKPSLESIVSLGRSGGNAVETKKRAQKGEL
ncbi:MAG: AbrB/MazE/SpoVT family DNA-binding domain-containing protein [Thaumarchaeota archaeon]|nr:AbrB/MazE/SpoVT family DNA-binding domain-containing protein [Nitrososphaerota archaeon]